MVSIIVPVYNCAVSLERCIHAIITQTCQDWELILIDDGSTDESGTICDQAAAGHSQIRVIHKSNGGVSSARNAGIDAAEGEFILFCDSDDYPEPDWCAALLEAGHTVPDTFPICNYFRSRENEQTINYQRQCLDVPSHVLPQDFFLLYQLELLGTPWNKLYRRSLLRDQRLYFPDGLSLGEDLIFNLKYMRHLQGGFTFINRPLYHYSLGNDNSLTLKYHKNLLELYSAVFSELKASLTQFPGALERYSSGYWTSCFFAFDRIFRNTCSPQNQMSRHAQRSYNAAVFHSALFQECRREIPSTLIHPLQYLALRSNSFRIYWSTVLLTEWLSALLHSK